MFNFSAGENSLIELLKITPDYDICIARLILFYYFILLAK